MATSVYYNSLAIENVRCFGERQELDLTADGRRPARWTLILGDNNVGLPLCKRRGERRYRLHQALVRVVATTGFEPVT